MKKPDHSGAEHPRRVLIIAGPTASGKSARALEIASRENGIIINADSMQIYNGLPVLTAQPSARDRAACPHRLYGILDPGDRCSAAMWRDMALSEIYAALDAGQTPIICGGTGFYIQALTEGFSPMPDVSPEVRTRVQDLQAAMGNPAFHALVSSRDPDSGARLHENDTQRLCRALEVLEASGQSIGWWQAQPRTGAPAGLRFETEIVMPLRTELYARINIRFDAMMESGVLDEVRAFSMAILRRDYPEDAPLVHALGYVPLCAYLRGDLSREDAVVQAKTETRQYAKRQMTWWRRSRDPVH